jgi:hypothetical protein
MTVAATRMHRSLVDHASAFPDVYDTLERPFLFILLTRAISFQGYRTGEFQTTDEQCHILGGQTGQAHIESAESDRGNRAYGYRGPCNNPDQRSRLLQYHRCTDAWKAECMGC